jgi:hypothetical protein
MINFDMKLGFPAFDELGDIDMCLTIFSRLFCEDQFLKSPSLLEKHDALEVKKLIEEALEFYKANGYKFEIAGLGYGMPPEGDKQEEGALSAVEDANAAPVLINVKAFHFRLIAPNYGRAAAAAAAAAKAAIAAVAAAANAAAAATVGHGASATAAGAAVGAGGDGTAVAAAAAAVPVPPVQAGTPAVFDKKLKL